MARTNKAKLPAKPSAETRPVLAMAVLAEKVLLEPDGAATIVRVVDRLNLGAEAGQLPESMLTLPNVTIVAAFRSAGFAGKCVVSITHVTPSGEIMRTGISNIEFDKRPGKVVYVQAPLAVKWEGEGVYWYNILLDDKLYSRIPITIEIAKPSKSTKNVKK